jgi:hypothetical protein
MSAPCFALSGRYRPPAVLRAIACDIATRESEIRQRMGIRIEEGARFGLGFRDFEDGMVWLGMEAYTHPALIGLTMRMFDAFDWWENAFFAPFRAGRKRIDLLRRTRTLRLFARLFEWDMTCNLLRGELRHLPHPGLHAELGARLAPGLGGDQQHLWQATLGPDAVCFTTIPSALGALPGILDWERVPSPRGPGEERVIALYRSIAPALYVANRHRFTRLAAARLLRRGDEREGWIFARKERAIWRFAPASPSAGRRRRARTGVAS